MMMSGCVTCRSSRKKACVCKLARSRWKSYPGWAKEDLSSTVCNSWQCVEQLEHCHHLVVAVAWWSAYDAQTHRASVRNYLSRW